MLPKFRSKFYNELQSYKAAWRHSNVYNNEKCYTKRYEKVSNVDYIAEILLDIFTRGAQNHPKIQSIHSEYQTNNLGYYPIKIKTENGNEVVHIDKYGNKFWETVTGNYVAAFDESAASNLNAVELDTYSSFTKVIRTKSSNTYYDKMSKLMYKQCSSKFQKYGFISMDMDSKSPAPTGIESNRKKDQFTPLGRVFTSRNSVHKQNLFNDCFIKNIGEVIYPNYPDTRTAKIQPLSLYDKNKGLNVVNRTNYTTGGEEQTKRYSLSDLIIVIDIDCGKQIDYIKECASKMPFSPQCFTTETGIGITKKGNSTALVVVDAPITAEQRKLILTAYRYAFCCDFDVYAIDKSCTGIGYGKNPLKHFNGQLQREFEVLVDGTNYRTVHNLDNLIEWARSVVIKYYQFIDDHDDAFISACEELKNSTLKFSEIIHKLKETKSEFKIKSHTDGIFINTVSKGMRNDHFVKLEGPIYMMQHYLLHGINSVYDDNTALSVALKIEQDIKNRYDNSDHSISKNWIISRLKWIIEKDRKEFNDINNRRAFLEKLYHQRNICIHNKECRLMQLEGHRDFKETRFASILEFNELGLISTYTPTQQRHGADTQSMKSMLYACSKVNSAFMHIQKEMLQRKEEFLKDIQTNNLDNVLKLIPQTETDSTRRNILASLLLSNIAAHNIIQQYECTDSVGWCIESSDKHNKNDKITFWDFSLLYNKNFLHIDAPNKSNLIYQVALYVREFCKSMMAFGLNNANVSFKDIKPTDVKQVCKNMYDKFGANISIVHHIANSIKNKPVTPEVIYKELCSMHTQSISNKLISIICKHMHINESTCYEYLSHNYQSDIIISDSLQVDVNNQLNKLIGKNINKNACQNWISNDLLSHINHTLHKFKITNAKLYERVYKVIRKVISCYILETLKVTPTVTIDYNLVKVGLVHCKRAYEKGLDGLNGSYSFSAELYKQIKQLNVISALA